jgi:hypothetical protein
MSGQAFSIVPGNWAMVRLSPDAPLPDWALGARSFVSITRTRDELSIVCEARMVPEGARHQAGWALLALRGPFAFSEVGVLASIVGPLAAVGVPVFVLSTFDTDYLLVPDGRRDEALAALAAVGYSLEGE